MPFWRTTRPPDPAAMNTMEDDRQQPQGSQQPPLESTEELGAVLREKFLEFLEAFTEADAAKAANAPVPDDGEAQLYYVNQVHAMKTAEKTTLFVDFCHVDLHDWELARTIETEFLRVETYLRKVGRSFHACSCMPAALRMLWIVSRMRLRLNHEVLLETAADRLPLMRCRKA